MILLTGLQVTANVYATFKHLDISGNNDWTFWQRSILFGMETTTPEMYKVLIAWIQGALLPIVSLGLTGLVTQNIKLRNGNTTTTINENISSEEIQPKVTKNIKNEPSILDELNKTSPGEELIQNIQNEEKSSDIETINSQQKVYQNVSDSSEKQNNDQLHNTKSKVEIRDVKTK